MSRPRYALQHKEAVGRELALTALSKAGQLPIDDAVADTASQIAPVCKSGMAEALVYAVAQTARAEIRTQDRDFERLPNLRYFPEK